MNRRKFCQTLGAAIAGTAVLGVSTHTHNSVSGAGTSSPVDSFRAVKIRLEWLEQASSGLSPARKCEFVKRELLRVRAVFDTILSSGSENVSARFSGMFEAEAAKIGFRHFIAASPSETLVRECDSFAPLNFFGDTVCDTPSNPAEGAGFIFGRRVPQDGSESIQAWVAIYDPSLCRWESFVNSVHTVRYVSGDGEGRLREIIARKLDSARRECFA